MYDTVIRGATVVDGTGSAGYSADVAVQDGVIVEIGRVGSPARESIHADGAIVTPGFIDLHTHYDGQVLWDEAMDPSFAHGVTTAVAGNCGVGFAPVTPEHRQRLIEMMEGVEEIPGIVLDEGLDWNWRSFPTASTASRRARTRWTSRATSPTRRCGWPSWASARSTTRRPCPRTSRRCPASSARPWPPGRSASPPGRLTEHISSSGSQIPGTFAREDEILALARAMGESGRGAFETVPKGAVGAVMGDAEGRAIRLEEHRLYERIARSRRSAASSSRSWGGLDSPSPPGARPPHRTMPTCRTSGTERRSRPSAPAPRSPPSRP
jgi:hypothetical protein